MELLILIPIIVVIAYGTFQFQGGNKINRLYIICAVLALSIIMLLISLNHYPLPIILLMILTLDTVIYFLLLRIQDKATLLFTFLFSCSLGILFFIAYQYSETTIYITFIIAISFLLAENNQIFMRKTYEQSATEYQNKILDKQVEEVQNIYLTMRSWRHDYHNHLQKLKAHIMMEQITEANQYLNELEIDLDNVNQLVESGNINLDAILNSKLSLAIKNNIEINYKAQVPKTLTVTDIDLCVVIGNLIDNAVEACQKIKNSDPRFIRLYIGIFKKQLYISVSNSTREIIRKLDEGYITTKRGNHGHGLKRINIIVEKYKGYINRKNEPKVFVTEILLPL